LLKPSVEEFGAQRVWEGAIEFFGYPVTWDLDISQVICLRKFLEGMKS